MFNDITELLLRPGVFRDAVDMFVERYRGMGIAAVAGKTESGTASHHWFTMVSGGAAARLPNCLRLPLMTAARCCRQFRLTLGALGRAGAARWCSEIP